MAKEISVSAFAQSVPSPRLKPEALGGEDSRVGSFPVLQSSSMQTTTDFFCAFCGEPNTTFVDLSAGLQQSYVEDCQVCCRPNVLFVRVDPETAEVEIDAHCES